MELTRRSPEDTKSTPTNLQFHSLVSGLVRGGTLEMRNAYVRHRCMQIT
jgi:hypothetical protein